MHGPVGDAELLDGAHGGKDEPVRGAGRRALAVDGLRAGDDDLLDGQVVLADDLQHLRGAEAVDLHVLGDLGHVAAVRALVKDHVDAFHGGAHRRAVSQIALDKFRLLVDPGGFAEAVGLGFEVVEDANGPAFAEEVVGDVRADEARAAGDEGAFEGRHKSRR